MKCQYCDRTAKNLNSHRQHEIRCRNNPNKINIEYLSNRTIKYKIVIPITPCIHCGKTYSTSIGLSNHKIRCPKNPHRVIQELTPEARQRLIEINQGKTWSDEKKANHSRVMKNAVRGNPESYTSSNRGRTRQIIVDGIKFQGRWEVDFYLWAKSQGLNPRRPTESFTYEWNGTRSYFPDFYIESLDLYVEVKGYETDRDRAKWLTFPKKLRIIKSLEIKQIRQGTFVGL